MLIDGRSRKILAGTRSWSPDVPRARSVRKIIDAVEISARIPATMMFLEIRAAGTWTESAFELVSRMMPQKTTRKNGGYGAAQGCVEYGFSPLRRIKLLGMSAPSKSPPPSLRRTSMYFPAAAKAKKTVKITGDARVSNISAYARLCLCRRRIPSENIRKLGLILRC